MADEVSGGAAVGLGKHARWLHALVLACCGWSAAGCDSASFVPPRPAQLSGEAAGAVHAAGPAGAIVGNSSPSAHTIEVIAGPLEGMDSEALLSVARIEAGLHAVLVDVQVAGQKGNPSKASDLVESVAARKPLALVLFFLDENEPEMARTIAAARGKGVPVLVVAGPKARPTAPGTKEASGKEVAAATSAALIHVVPESFQEAVQSMVAAAVRNARNARLRPEDGAVLMVNKQGDPLVPERARAFRDALKSAGITAIDEIHFDPELKPTRKKVVELMRANLKPVIIVSAEHIGLTASFEAMNDLREGRPYVVAGFTHEESGSNMTKMGEFAAIAVFSPERLLRKAVSVAAAIGRGERVPDPVEVLVPTIVSPENSKTATIYRRFGAGASQGGR